MKKIIASYLFAVMLIASCKCNNDVEEHTTTAVDTVQYADSVSKTDSSAGTVSGEWPDEYSRLYNMQYYTREQVREYRRLHDEMDWGGVPGYYPEGSTRALTEDDTKFLTEWGHKVMLNEIYARHGMTFADQDLENHFSNQDWYKSKNRNVQNLLTQQERENIAFLDAHPAKTM